MLLVRIKASKLTNSDINNWSVQCGPQRIKSEKKRLCVKIEVKVKCGATRARWVVWVVAVRLKRLSRSPAQPPTHHHPTTLPTEPDRQSQQECGIITWFPSEANKDSPFSFYLTRRDHCRPGDSHRCGWPHVRKQRQAHLLHPAGGALLLGGAQNGLVALSHNSHSAVIR